jgi:hypothetical protein
VEIVGRSIFDATFGAEQRKFENEIAAGQLELTRFAADHARLETDLEHVPATIIQEPPVPELPPWFSLKWCAWASCLVCFGLSAAGAVSNIVFRLLPDTQAIFPAVVVSVVWVLLSVASKIGIRAVRSPVREVLHWTIAGVGLLGAVLWLAGLVVSYASEINLNDIAATDVLSRSKAMPFVTDRNLLFGRPHVLSAARVIYCRSPQPILLEFTCFFEIDDSKAARSHFGFGDTIKRTSLKISDQVDAYRLGDVQVPWFPTPSSN